MASIREILLSNAASGFNTVGLKINPDGSGYLNQNHVGRFIAAMESSQSNVKVLKSFKKENRMEITRENLSLYKVVLGTICHQLRLQGIKNTQIISFDLDTEKRVVKGRYLSLSHSWEELCADTKYEIEATTDEGTFEFGGDVYTKLKSPIKKIEIWKHTFR